jgi:hypothetical protein
MKSIRILTILFAFVPTLALAQDGRSKTEPAPRVRRAPAPVPADFVAPGVLRQDLFDRNNPNNLRHDYPSAPAQPGQY